MVKRSDLEMSAKAAVELGRRRSRADLYWFAREVLGYKDLNESLHRDGVVSFLCKDGRRKMLLLPRGHLKTTLATISYAIWRVIRNPNIRILLANAIEKNAESFLREIKGHFERNEMLREFFPEFRSEEWPRWIAESVTCRRGRHMKEATISTVGMGGKLASQHYDLIIMDDIVERAQVATEGLLGDAILWYKDALDLLEPNGEIVYIGTRWHEQDMAGWLIDEQSDAFRFSDGTKAVMVRKVMEIAESPYERSISVLTKNGTPIFPEKFDRGVVEGLLREKGPDEVSAQYFNEPMPEDTATFRRAWLQYYDAGSLPRDETGATKPHLRFITVDPAWTTNRNSDYTGIVLNAVTPDNDWWLLDAWRFKKTSGELMKVLFALDEKYKPRAIGFEFHAMQTIFRDPLNEEMRRRGRFLPIVELDPKTSTPNAKQERIVGMQARFQNGTVHFPVTPGTNNQIGSEGLNVLKDQLLRFRYRRARKSMVDNLLDALAYQQQIAHAPLPMQDEPELAAVGYNEFTGSPV